MIQQFLNWRTLLAVIAIGIVSGTIFYSTYLTKKLAIEERQKVEAWIEAGKFLITSPLDADTKLASMIITENSSIPIIETDENDKIIQYVNLNAHKADNDNTYLLKKLAEFKSQNPPVRWNNPTDSIKQNLYYYGDSTLLKEIKYYPFVQLFIVALFIIISITTLRANYISTQNQLWAGMAKETAHQLGTPVSSLEGWLEMIKENGFNDNIIPELEKDVDKLRLVSDRFGKIGSKPQLEEKDIVHQIDLMVEYMRKRAAGNIRINFNASDHETVICRISGPLFDWVIENLLKNALDAMDGKGDINIALTNNEKDIYIDITDNGKGISSQHIKNIFNPGFTTKKRGWGLGLALSKRIIDQYHNGHLFVKQSELSKGTTFRIILKK
jgi:signal transduction histidine kinase